MDLDAALGLTRDGQGMVAHVPKFRFIKTQFPAQKIFLTGLKKEIKFHIPRQNDLARGTSVGVFETDDDAVATELLALVANSPSPLYITQATA